MRIEKWGGLLTSASAYAIPPGGAVVQVNLQNTIPGQLSCRGGMREVSFSNGMSGSNDVRELFRYSFGIGREEKILVFDASGSIQVVSTPTLGPETPKDAPCLSTLPVFPGGGNYPPGAGGGSGGGTTPPPGVEVGACCIGGVCVPGRTPEQCVMAGGIWMGADTSCEATVCLPIDEGGGGGGGTPGGYNPCVIDGGNAFTECCTCDSLDGGNAFTCCL